MSRYPFSKITTLKRKYIPDKLPKELYLFSAIKIEHAPIILFLHGAFLIRDGQLSQARMGLNLANNQTVIVKLTTPSLHSPSSCFRNELFALKLQNRLIHCGHLGNYFFLITPFIKSRSLRLILQQDYLTDIEKLKISISIGLILLDLRKIGIIHGDLSPEHILVSEENPRKIDIIDFNIAYVNDNPANVIFINSTSGFYKPAKFANFSQQFFLTDPEQCEPQAKIYRGIFTDESCAFGCLILKLFFPFLTGQYALLNFFSMPHSFKNSQLILQTLKVAYRLTQREPWYRINLLSGIWWLIYIYEFFKAPEKINHSLPEFPTPYRWKLVIESHPKFRENRLAFMHAQNDKMSGIISIKRGFSRISNYFSYTIHVKEEKYDDSEFSPYFSQPYSIINEYTIQCTCKGLSVFKPLERIEQFPAWLQPLLADSAVQTSMEILKLKHPFSS